MDEAQIHEIMSKLKAVYWNKALLDDDLVQTVRSPEIIDALVNRLSSDDYVVRTDAGWALADVAGDVAKPYLLNALQDDSWQARAAAAGVLGHYDDLEIVNSLIPLLHDSELPVRIAATDSLGALRKPSVVPHLIEAIQDPSRGIYDYAIYALYEIVQEHEIPELTPLLESDDVHVHVAAAYVLGASGGKAAVRGLIDLVREGIRGDKTEYEKAVRELIKIGQVAVPELIEALNERDEVLSQMAIEALTQIGDEGALPHIVAALSDNNDQIYRAAIWGIAMFGNDAVEPLLAALRSSNPIRRSNALNTLERMNTLTALAAVEQWKREQGGGQAL